VHTADGVPNTLCCFLLQCTKCAFGVSTPGKGSTREADCRVIEPGYYASVMVNGSVRATAPCPQSYW
jgi:hypothetical protein